MSASLVGSEMCIRDSMCAAQYTARSTAQPCILQHDNKRDMQRVRSHATVSYTHLTLPTICSV
eukprot:14757892-Alexandrium_andersonii.AAC.1